MIGPFILSHPPSEFTVIVGATAYVDYEVSFFMIFVEVVCHIVDGVSVCLFEEIGGGIGHGDDSIGDIS